MPAGDAREIGNIDTTKMLLQKIKEVEINHQKHWKLNEKILQSCATFSRIMYQISPNVARKTSISTNNLTDVLTFIGINIERIINVCRLENIDFMRTNSLNFVDGDSNQQYQFLRLHPYQDSLESIKEIE